MIVHVKLGYGITEKIAGEVGVNRVRVDQPTIR